ALHRPHPRTLAGRAIAHGRARPFDGSRVPVAPGAAVPECGLEHVANVAAGAGPVLWRGHLPNLASALLESRALAAALRMGPAGGRRLLRRVAPAELRLHARRVRLLPAPVHVGGIHGRRADAA